jgi:SAM-dependent methyltransferase
MQFSPEGSELERIYRIRFAGRTEYRAQVWKVLAPYFGRHFNSTGTVLDLGAGYCEFINNSAAHVKYAMDLNPDVQQRAAKDVTLLLQDCSEPWPLPDESLDAVFTSNFLEHLPHKAAIKAVLANAYRCLKPGGRFVAVGPNIRYLAGAYWDFFDHFVELTDLSVSEAFSNSGFEVATRIPRHLPYTMSDGRRYPIWVLRLYLALPFLWPLFGKQFLVVARKPLESEV